MTYTANNKKGKALGKYEIEGNHIFISVDKRFTKNSKVLKVEEKITKIAEKKHKVKIAYTSFLNLEAE